MLSLWEFFPYPTADAGSFTITGQEASFDQVLAASNGAFALAGKSALFSEVLSTSAGAFALTGEPASFSQVLHASSGASPSICSLELADGGLLLLADGLGGHLLLADCSFELTGESATFAQQLRTETGTYTFTGFDASFSIVTSGDTTLVADTGTFTFTGFDADFSVTGGEVVTPTGGGINWLPYGFMWGRTGYPRETEAAARHARHIAHEAEKVKFGGRKTTAEAKRKLRALIAQANAIAEENELTAELRRLERYLAQRKSEQALLGQQKLVIELALRVEMILLGRVVDDDEALTILMMSNAIH